MTRLAILTEEEQLKFDYPPLLSAEAQAICFAITPELETRLNRLRTATNKVGFLLQYGYFKACKRFFVINRFRQEDIEYGAKIIGVNLADVNITIYKKKTPTDHQKIILEMLDYKPLTANQTWLEKEIVRHIERFTEPRELFFEIINILNDHQIEFPSCHKLSELITVHYLKYEDRLFKTIKKDLPVENKNKLNSLLIADHPKSQGVLSQYKTINQSTKPKAIQASLALFEQIGELFHSLLPVIKKLSLTPQSCDYYATWVKKSKLSQLKQMPDKNRAHLYLIAFLQHQYYLRQDTFVDIFLRCVQSAKNTITKRLTAADKLSRNERRAAVKHMTKANKNYRELIDEITDITKSSVFTASGKIQKITELLNEHEEQKNEVAQQQLELFELSLDRIAKDKDYFDTLEKLSVKLQNRISGILKSLTFNAKNSNKAILAAVEHYRKKEGQINHLAPTAFLKPDEKNAIMNHQGKFRISLYKILLFIHTADAIKSGELNLEYSYRYLSITDYLVGDKKWHEERDELIKLTGLEKFSNYEAMMKELRLHLNDKYETVNNSFLGNRNPYLSINNHGLVQVTTPALAEKETEHISALLDQVGYVPILRILSEIDELTDFTKSFKHHKVKDTKRRPRADVFSAGIIGLGCNIGVPKMGRISTGVNENTLKNAVNWYFSKKNLKEANDSIIKLLYKLTLPNVFATNKDEVHASSDGRKFNVGVESLLATYSFKYFGKDKGISVYTFIDERQALFHSLAMSSSDREAAYVIDGLNDNNVTKVDIHSTDTHGYTELIFAATHFIDVAFAPRLKNIGKQRIYAFSSKKTYEKKGYKILPSRPINQKLIAKYWDDILRFMVTIKLKEVTASQLFKRLSSYAKDNPLYKAIKEFGRIIKSLFVLTYFDDVKLRQRIEKQLNRIELSNKFSNAVFYANNGEFNQATPEDQEVAIGCKGLIQNAIVLWNYLYLSQLLTNCQDDNERSEMVGLIREGSVLCWAHINLHGEFNFKQYSANDMPFNMSKILSLKVG